MKDQHVEKKMGQDYFTYLPSEIIINNIFLRLPLWTVTACSHVCKSWFSLIETPEFCNAYFYRSSFPAASELALFQDEIPSKPFKLLVFEFLDDRIRIQTRSSYSSYPCKAVLNFSFSSPLHDLLMHSSVSGLLLMIDRSKTHHFIFNPITREHIKLSPPRKAFSWIRSLGFGLSRLSGQYKVVRMFRERWHSSLKCEVYTVGTGSWRRASSDCGVRRCIQMSRGVFLNGNLHWLAIESWRSVLKILCFDLEAECFSTFSVHPYAYGCNYRCQNLCAIGDRLCFCSDSFGDIFVWFMNKYGDDKSWRKEHVIRWQLHPDLPYINFRPRVILIRIFEDGDIWFANETSPGMYCYSSKTKTVRLIVLPGLVGANCSRVMNYTPSFLSLRNFANENSSSF